MGKSIFPPTKELLAENAYECSVSLKALGETQQIVDKDEMAGLKRLSTADEHYRKVMS